MEGPERACGLAGAFAVVTRALMFSCSDMGVCHNEISPASVTPSSSSPLFTAPRRLGDWRCSRSFRASLFYAMLFCVILCYAMTSSLTPSPTLIDTFNCYLSSLVTLRLGLRSIFGSRVVSLCRHS